MATTPTSKNASYALLEARSNLSLTGRQARLAMKLSSTSAVAPTTADENLGAGSEGLTALFHPRNTSMDVSWRLSTQTSNITPETGTLGVGFFLFRDNQDGAGIGTNRVKFYNLEGLTETLRTFPSGGFASQATGQFTIPAGDLIQAGTYKIVPVMWKIDDQVTESDTTPPLSSQANASGGSEFYVDADSNINASTGVGASPALNTFVTGRVGWIRVAADVQDISVSISNQGYGSSPVVIYDICGGSLNNMKQIRVGTVQPADLVTASPVDTITNTPLSTGANNGTLTYNVDAIYPGPATSHTLRIYCGPAGGQSSTLAAETPDLLSAGTQFIPNANDKAWVVFGTPVSGFTAKNSYCVERNSTFQIGSDIYVYKDLAHTQYGVGSFNDSGYSQSNRLFKRVPISVVTDRCIPYLEAYITNVFGTAIATSSFVAAVQRNFDQGTENTQTLTTDANGRIRWNYTIGLTNSAFNRFLATGATRVTGSNVTTGPDDIASPPLVINDSEVYGAFFTGNFPAYGKDVLITGNVASFIPQPSKRVTNVFGVNSEGIIQSVWTGNISDAFIDSNGVATGPGTRTKTLGGGSLKAKPASLINEATIRVIDTSQFVLRDVAGRNYDLSGAEKWTVRRGIYNKTTDAAIDTGTAQVAATDIDTPLAAGGTGTNSLIDITAPTDPARLSVYLAFAPTTAQRDTFSVNSSAPETAGFATDSGNFGYVTQLVEYIEVNPNLIITAALKEGNITQGSTIHIHGKFERILPDQSRISVFADEAFVYIDRVSVDGYQIESPAPLAYAMMSPVNTNSFSYTNFGVAGITIDASHTKIAQRFVLTEAKSISSFTVKLFSNSSLVCNVEIENDSGGSPSGIVSQSGLTSSNFSFGNGTSIVTGTFTKESQIGPGTFWLVFTRVSGTGSFDGNTTGTANQVKIFTTSWGTGTLSNIYLSLNGSQSPYWTYTYTVPNLPFAGFTQVYSTTISGTIDGSRPTSPGRISFVVGNPESGVYPSSFFFNLTTLGEPWTVNRILAVGFSLRKGGAGLIMDPNTVKYNLIRIHDATVGTEYLASDGVTWVPFGGNAPDYQLSMTDAPDLLSATAFHFDTSTWLHGTYFLESSGFRKNVQYSSTIQWQTVANPRYVVQAFAGSTSNFDGAWQQGQGFSAVGTFIDGFTGNLILADELTPGIPEVYITIMRPGSTVQGTEYLAADGLTWRDVATQGPIYRHRATKSVLTPGRAFKNFLDTSTWSKTQDLLIIIEAQKDNVHYQGTYTLVVYPQNVTISVAAGNPATPGTHVVPGDPIVFGAVIEDLNGKLSQTAGQSKIAIRRFNSSLGTTEYLDGYFAWQTGDTFFYHTMSVSPVDSKIALFTIPSNVTANFTTDDLLVRVKMQRNGTDYSNDAQVIVVDGKNRHDKNVFDPTGLFK